MVHQRRERGGRQPRESQLIDDMVGNRIAPILTSRFGAAPMLRRGHGGFLERPEGGSGRGVGGE